MEKWTTWSSRGRTLCAEPSAPVWKSYFCLYLVPVSLWLALFYPVADTVTCLKLHGSGGLENVGSGSCVLFRVGCGFLRRRADHITSVLVPGDSNQERAGEAGVESPLLAGLPRNHHSQPEERWPRLLVFCKPLCCSNSMVLDKACYLFEPHFSRLRNGV